MWQDVGRRTQFESTDGVTAERSQTRTDEAAADTRSEGKQMGTSSTSSWLDEVRRAAESGEPTLVVCRTGASVRAVYRALTDGSQDGPPKGWVGLQVTTLHGLVEASAPHSLLPEAASADEPMLPPGHNWREQLADRPGLRRLLRHHVGRAHRLRAAGVRLDGMRPEILRLVEEGWGPPDDLAGIVRMMEKAAPNGHRFAVGFADAPLTFAGRVSPVERRLLGTLGCKPVESGRPPVSLETAGESKNGIPSIHVHDVAAEAREVAVQAMDAGAEGVLILVADDDSERRIRAALQRNTVRTAADGSIPLRHHALAGILESLVPVFASGGEAPLDVADLLRLVTDPVLSRTPPSNSGYVPVEGLDEQRASVRHIHDLLGECHRPRGTLAEWLGGVATIVKKREADVEEAEPEHVESQRRRLASARILLADLKVIAKRVKEGARLGELARCANDLGLADPTDRLGHAIIRALRDAGFEPAAPDTYEDALAHGVGSGRVDGGVQILSYDDYDGRPCRRLVLTGVHNKGLARAPERDPFLREADLGVLGLPTPAATVRERLVLARWAAVRAEERVAIVTETDASGRRVAPPVGLPLVFAEDVAAGGAYGLACSLPETTSRSAFAEGTASADSMAVQIDAEWTRSGAVFAVHPERATIEIGTQSTVLDYLARDLPALPERLRPWLGRSGMHPTTKDGLPPGFALSATRLTAFTQCPYRALCQSVLRLEKRDEIEEELDAREVGSALHDAVEHALLGQQLAIPSAKLDAAQRSLVKRLELATTAAVKSAAATRLAGTEQESLGTARAGLVERWNQQWRRYAVRLLEPLEDLNAEAREPRIGSGGIPALLEAAVAVIAREDMKAGPRDALAKALKKAVLEHGGDVAGLSKTLDGYAAEQNEKNAGILGAALARADVKKSLKKLCDAAAAAFGDVEYAPDGDLEVVMCEHDLGGGSKGGKAAKPFGIPLGDGTVIVHGRIDAVVRRQGVGKRKGTNYRIIDFKTGRWVPTKEQVYPSLVQPQLPFYALALAAAGPVRDGDRRPVVVEWIGYRAPRAAAEFGGMWTGEMAAHAARVFGEVLDHARAGFFPLVPNAEGCPFKKYKGAYCDYGEICRLRAGFGADAGLESADQEVSP